jgi:hypothetical protein
VETVETSSIELSGAEIDRIELADGRLRLHFPCVHIVKTMTGSAERTRWWQAGELIVDGAQPLAPLPLAPVLCAGGDIDENVYTYRDMIPLPLHGRGRVGCDLKLAGTEARISVRGEVLRLEMEGVPKYIEHLRPDPR